jgi:hypothetical protein
LIELLKQRKQKTKTKTKTLFSSLSGNCMN